MIGPIPPDDQPILRGEPQLDHRTIVNNLLGHAFVNNGYYSVDPTNAQVCYDVAYKHTGEDFGVTSIHVTGPPLVPRVLDEISPADLLNAAKSDTPQQAPLIKNLKCIEIQLKQSHPGADGRQIVDEDGIYRVDLTKNQPVGYKREPLSEEESRSGNPPLDQNDVVGAINRFLQPFPRYRYVRMSPAETNRLFATVQQCQQKGTLVDQSKVIARLK